MIGKQVHRIFYKNHVPTTPLQKLSLAVLSSLNVFTDPTKANDLATLGEVTGHAALGKMHEKMCEDPVGRVILHEKPLVAKDTVDVSKLLQYPKGTFGRAYAEFLNKHGFDPDERARVQYVDDEELAYVMQRYREMHDFWHVLFDIPPTEFGEIILKYVELTQTKLPVCALSGLVGPLRLTRDERKLLFRTYIPWAYDVGTSCPNLMAVYYEKEFNTTLSALRNRLGITTAPLY